MHDAPAPEGPDIGKLPLVVFVLVLIIPLLNFAFTYHQMTLKLFVFQTAATVLWCALAWQAATGRLHASDLPAWWLFAPAAAWVGWGALTALWSPQGWLASTWVVQDFYGVAGAFGLAVLLRSSETRNMFVAASSVIVFVAAVFVFISFGDAASGYFGDVDVGARDAVAGFVLIPTLVAAAFLYGTVSEGERDYKRVLWLVFLLLVLLGVGFRLGTAPGTDSTLGPLPRVEFLAWLFGLGAGVAVALWMLAPRFQQSALCRIAAVGLAAVVALAFVQREKQLGGIFDDPDHIYSSHRAVRYALLDRCERQMTAEGGLGRLLAGNGTGTFSVAFDKYRPPETFAMRHPSMTDEIVQKHARRLVTEVAFERGLIGLGIALAGVLACVGVGWMVLRRARDADDGALGAGIAAGAVGLVVLAGLSKGPVGFGASYAFWVGLGLLGALTVQHGRSTRLARSPEETFARGRTAGGQAEGAAVGAIVVLAAMWFFLALRPMLGEYHLSGAIEEFKAAQELRGEALEAARRTGKMPEMSVCKEHVDRTRQYLGRVRSLSLGGRVWLQAEMELAQCDSEFGRPERAVQRYESLDRLCGSGYGLLAVREAQARARAGQRERAHELFMKHSHKNPLACPTALMNSDIPLFAWWRILITAERDEGGPDWEAWAWDYIDAATRGLALDDERYGLRLARGTMYFLLRREEEAMADTVSAIQYIEDVLRTRGPGRYYRARLLMELAHAYLLWDPDYAFGVAMSVRQLNPDWQAPHYQSIFMDMQRLVAALAPPPPEPREPPAESEEKAPDAAPDKAVQKH
jgi:hypothetical protein